MMTPTYFVEWRRYRGLTQADVAKALRLSPTEISRLENGWRAFTAGFLHDLGMLVGCHQWGDLLTTPPPQGGPVPYKPPPFVRWRDRERREREGGR